MTAGMGDQAAGVAGRGYLRASDADREQVIDALKTAFVQGLLTKDELGMRAGQALTARTHGELAAITAGISAMPAPARPPAPARAGARKPVKKVLAWGACVVIPPALGAAFLTYYGGFFVLFLLTFIGTGVTAGPPRATRRR